MAAVVAEGVTTIHNAAREPDVDLYDVEPMGAQVEGASSRLSPVSRGCIQPEHR